MKFSNVLAAIFLVAVFSCSKASSSTEHVDSTAAVAVQDTLANVQPGDSVIINYATPVEGLQGTDTLFNYLARLQLVQGEFQTAEVVTNSFIDTNNLSREGLIALLVITGEGEYNGGRENIQFATQHALLAVFEWTKEGSLVLVDHLDLGTSENFGLYAYDVGGEALMLSDDRYGVLIHNKSSEEGAGDGGFRKDVVSLYVFVKGKITAVFETTVNDFQFSSDEQGSWYESTTTVQVTVLEEKTNGLFDLGTVSSTVTNGSEPEEEESGEESAPQQEPENPTEPSSEDNNATFKWNGEAYELAVND
jgi:hypothetical protein